MDIIVFVTEDNHKTNRSMARRFGHTFLEYQLNSRRFIHFMLDER